MFFSNYFRDKVYSVPLAQRSYTLIPASSVKKWQKEAKIKAPECELKQRIGHSYVRIAQQIIHEAAKVKNEPKIIKLCETLDLIASEAQYHHRNYYRNYTRSVATLIDIERDPKCSTDESQTHSEQTQIGEGSIFQTWFDFIEKSFFKSRKITTVNALILKLEQLLIANNASDYLQNAKSFKKKIRRRLEIEFKARAGIYS